MAEAVEAGTAASAEFDLVESLSLLIAANVVIGIDGPAPALPSKRRTSSRPPRQRPVLAPSEVQHGALFG
jgi:hypothetical protein